jgi:hypothetical protein
MTQMGSPMGQGVVPVGRCVVCGGETQVQTLCRLLPDGERPGDFCFDLCPDCARFYQERFDVPLRPPRAGGSPVPARTARP